MRFPRRPRPSRGPRPPRLLAAVFLTPLLVGCFASSGGDDDADSGADDGSRLRVALAFPPAENLSPYGADATILSRLGVTEGLTALDANGAAAPALAASWRRVDDRSWLFTLREAAFQDGTEVTPAAVAASLTHATEAQPVPAALSGVTLTAKAEGRTGVRVTTAAPDPVLPLRLSSPGLAVLAPKAYGKRGPSIRSAPPPDPSNSPRSPAPPPPTWTASTTTGAAGRRPPASRRASSPTAPPAPTPCAPDRSTSPRRYPSPRRPPSTRTPAVRPPRPAPPACCSTRSRVSSRTRPCGPPRGRPSTPRPSPRVSTRGTRTPAPASTAPPSPGPRASVSSPPGGRGPVVPAVTRSPSPPMTTGPNSRKPHRC